MGYWATSQRTGNAEDGVAGLVEGLVVAFLGAVAFGFTFRPARFSATALFLIACAAAWTAVVLTR